MSRDGETWYLLSLADGARLGLSPGDADAARVVEFLARAAQVPAARDLPGRGVLRLRVVTGDGPQPEPEEGTSLCRLRPTDERRLVARARTAAGRPSVLREPVAPQQWLWGQLVRLSAAIGRQVGASGGVMLHGALAEWAPVDGQRGMGVLLGGRSGIGKTTAGLRLRPPWRCLADDMALVVRDEQGVLWAHPWPTWSRLLGDDVQHPDGRWDVQRAVPLQALFFLEQAAVDRAEALGPAHALCRLAALAAQSSRQTLAGHPPAEVMAVHLERFQNLCVLAKELPAFVLHVSLDGAFWQAMEQSLGLAAAGASPTGSA